MVFREASKESRAISVNAMLLSSVTPLSLH